MFLNTLQRGNTSAQVLLGLACLSVVLLVGWLWTAVQLARLTQRLTSLTRGADGTSLEATLNTHLNTVAQTQQRMDALEQSVGVLQAQIPGCIQHVHMVRYDAFEDVGGQQSFSIVLLDGQNNGLVLSGVCSRSDVRVYAKSIQNGQPSHALSQEEIRALRGG